MTDVDTEARTVREPEPPTPAEEPLGIGVPSDAALPADPRARALAVLRQPFPPHQVSMLPKQVRGGDSDKGRCDAAHRQYSADGRFCGGYHARSVHLDYVGHAALTDRLLDADPGWSWEPLASTDEGLPLFDRQGGLWIRLTVAGVARLGYGDSQGKTGPNATKEAIGDALRNAGMRFGAALDLWHKGDLHDAAEQRGTEEAPAPASRPNTGGTAPGDTHAGNGRDAGAREPANGWPDRAHDRDEWRRRVLGTETLADQHDVPGLRTVYQQAKGAGILGQRVVESDPETFTALLQRLSRELPENPPAEGDTPAVLDDDPWGPGTPTSNGNGAWSR